MEEAMWLWTALVGLCAVIARMALLLEARSQTIHRLEHERVLERYFRDRSEENAARLFEENTALKYKLARGKNRVPPNHAGGQAS